MIMRLFLLFVPLVLWASNLDLLLQKYRKLHELSKITKRDSAGFVYVYTREDLERMQAYTLADIMRTVPGLNYTLTPNYLHLFSPLSLSYAPPTIARLYINNHDVTSASFGSALLIWGEMPTEYIDHIEVYKDASSIEFGDEPAIIIIKVYTKLPLRELGNKLRLVADHRSSKGMDLYTAQLFDASSLFGYVHGYNLHAKKYRHNGYTYSRDKKDFLAFIQYNTPSATFEVAHYSLIKDPFMGYGFSTMPRDGGLHAYHNYITYTTKPKEGAIWTLALDTLRYARYYQEDGIGIPTSHGSVHSYRITYDDTIATIKYQKHITRGKNTLLIGGFYKYKGYRSHGTYDSTQSKAHNAYNLFSLYVEDSYHLDPATLFILSCKGDYYSFMHTVDDHKESIIRLGIIKNIGSWQVKGFYTKTYIPVQPFRLYSRDNFPRRTNPHLTFPSTQLFSIEAKFTTNSHTLQIKSGIRQIENTIRYDRRRGYYNQTDTLYAHFIEANYAYTKEHNKIMIDIAKGDNSQKTLSPNLQIALRTFYDYKKWNIYNELLYNKNYTYFSIPVKRALDYTVGVQYHYTHDLTVGIQAQNLFNEGYAQAYRTLKGAVPVRDRRYILNVEYTF